MVPIVTVINAVHGRKELNIFGDIDGELIVDLPGR